MVTYLVSKDSGDMGLADGSTRIEQIPLLVMRIADIFSKLASIKPPDRMFSYCVQFRTEYKATVKAMLADMKREGLPIGTEFYEIDGNSIFEIRGNSGGIVYNLCFYLICK